MANNDVKNVQKADSEHNWVFGGMFGFRPEDKNRRR
jgi:hypothetical protein